ncbi:POK9 protein, partial [Daphoenositta chrysoptera]|nr:POK9 protein [Daphoenositta chrysoptera]
ASMMGLFILPSVIDADYMGEIMIMAYTPFPPVKVQKGQRIAQLVPLPQLSRSVTPLLPQEREQKGFGSTGGLTLLTLDLTTRPKKQIQLHYQGQKRTLTALLDTGAETSIITPSNWPRDWPLQASTATITGVGGMTLAHKSPLLTVIIENKSTQVVFSIVQLPPTVQCLIGRDILAQLGVVL